MVKVCKAFFLTKLGYSKDNACLLRAFKNISKLNTCQDVPKIVKDGRGKYEKPNKFEHEAVKDHIESYRPALPYYRREHVPNRQYLPSGITVRAMHQLHSHQNEISSKMTYSLFWKIFKTMNIVMTQLGTEECKLCTRK